LESYAMIC